METFGEVIATVIFLTFLLLAVASFANVLANSNKIDACQKKNNVYECVLVAVPKQSK